MIVASCGAQPPFAFPSVAGYSTSNVVTTSSGPTNTRDRGISFVRLVTAAPLPLDSERLGRGRRPPVVLAPRLCFGRRLPGLRVRLMTEWFSVVLCL